MLTVWRILVTRATDAWSAQYYENDWDLVVRPRRSRSEQNGKVQHRSPTSSHVADHNAWSQSRLVCRYVSDRFYFQLVSICHLLGYFDPVLEEQRKREPNYFNFKTSWSVWLLRVGWLSRIYVHERVSALFQCCLVSLVLRVRV